MCLLSYFQPGAEVNIEHLCTGARNNPDGHGFALINSDNRLEVFKSMEFAETLARFVAARNANPDTDALFHSRITTHGLTSVENVHPFRAGRNGKHGNILVAHNGILPVSAQPDKGDPRSDTRLFAEDMFMGMFKDLDSPKVVRRLESWLTSYNKLVVLTTNPQYKRRAYILNESRGEWVKGVWHSNDSYLPRLYPMWAYSGSGYEFTPASGRKYASKAAEVGEHDCAYCWAKSSVEFGMCTACFTCKWCGEEDDACSCFVKILGPPKAIAAGSSEINAQPLDVDVTADSFTSGDDCAWCGEPDTSCCCLGGTARAEVEARAMDVGMSDGEMEDRWDALLAEYNIRRDDQEVR